VVTTAAATSKQIEVVDEQTRAAKLFAESLRAHELADRAERERAEAAASREQQGRELLAAKDEAAARLKRLRAEGRPRQQMSDADAAYRAALAALQEFETGERPHWAPAVEGEQRDEHASDELDD